jgi:crotonobetainyl-CoA:carnitine CoA-transferase CaiB-like acyl-CoA transferase
MLSLLSEERQWPAFTKCIDREDLRDDPRFATKPDRHARSVELIKLLDEVFLTRDFADWRQRLDGNGLVFGFVGILDDIPSDQQMKDNDILVPFEDSDIMTINSPIWIGGTTKKKPRLPPSVGQHSDEVLRDAGFDDAAIAALRASGAVA